MAGNMSAQRLEGVGSATYKNANCTTIVALRKNVRRAAQRETRTYARTGRHSSLQDPLHRTSNTQNLDLKGGEAIEEGLPRYRIV
jgi:hypothetical protein